MHICTVTVQCVNNFLFFFSLSSIKLQQTSAARKKNIQAPTPPSNYNKPNHQTQRHHQTPQPSTEKYPKINRNSKINPTQNQHKPKINKHPKINPTQNQLKLTGKPNPKTVHTHWKTQPNGARSAARSAASGSSIAVVGWRWEAKGRLWRREGGRKRKGGRID